MKNARYERKWAWLGWTAVPAFLLVVWQVTAVHLDQPWMFPPVSRVLEELAHPLRDHYALGTLLSNTWISLVRVAIGFAVAVTIGLPLGIGMGAMPRVRQLIEPTLEVIRPLCPIAWLPFAIAVFKLRTVPHALGLGYTHTVFDQVQLGMIFVIAVGGFFPILTNAIDGVAGVRRNYILLAQTLGASRVQCFFQVYLPAALPMILTGLRQGLGLCWFVIIAAEMMTGSTQGIGYLLMYAADNAAMDVVIASMVIIGVIGMGLNYGLQRLLRRWVAWQGREA